MCYLCVLIRSLQNLGASLKGFNSCGTKLRLRCADSRFAKPRNFLRGRTGCHFLHRAKSNQKARGARPCDPRFKALSKKFSKVFRRLVSKPVLPAKRRRKGFESVRKGDCTADARLMFFEKREGILQAHSRLSRMKFAVAR